MESIKLSALMLIFMLFVSSATPILGCGHCHHPKPKKPKTPKGPITLPPVTVPPIKPPVTLPPTLTPPGTKSPSGKTCPIDTLKLGACVDLLGGLVHIGAGDTVVKKCCPLLKGLAEIEAAVCLCTTLKLKLVNLNVYVPIALQLLITCGKTPPPGYTCSLQTLGS